MAGGVLHLEGAVVIYAKMFWQSRKTEGPTVQMQNAPASRELKYQVPFMQSPASGKFIGQRSSGAKATPDEVKKMQNFGFTLRWGHFRRILVGLPAATLPDGWKRRL